MVPQQPDQQIIEEPMYREQPQMTRNDWPQVMPQQPQVTQNKQSNSVWPEKLAKQAPVVVDKTSRKKGSSRDSDYSEEYAEGDESQSEGDDATTTHAPKKVIRRDSRNLNAFNIPQIFSEAAQAQKGERQAAEKSWETAQRAAEAAEEFK